MNNELKKTYLDLLNVNGINSIEELENTFNFKDLLPDFIADGYCQDSFQYMWFEIFKRFSSKRILLDSLQEEILLTIKKDRAYIKLQEDVYVGEFDLNNFSSEIKDVGDGKIIFIDTLMIEILFMCSTLFSLHKHGVTNDWYVEILSRLYLVYRKNLTPKEVFKGFNYIFKDTSQQSVLTIGETLYNTDAALRFVIAHEFAHAFRRLPTYKVVENPKSLKEKLINRMIHFNQRFIENDADYYATALLASSAKTLVQKENDNFERFSWVESINIGPTLFLSLHDLFKFLDKKLFQKKILDSSHPLSKKRLEYQIKHWRKDERTNPNWFTKRNSIRIIIDSLKEQVYLRLQLIEKQ